MAYKTNPSYSQGENIPYLHKINKKKNYTVIPFFGEYSGMAVGVNL